MNRIFQYIKDNFAGVSIIGVALVAILGLAIASGCSLSDIIKVQVPPAVQTATNSKATVSLSRAQYVRKQFVNDFTVALGEFDQNIEGASAFHDLATSLLNTGMIAGQGALASVPGGGILLALLTGVGGLYLKKPGTNETLNKEKQASFNAGSRRTKDLLAQAAVQAIDDAIGEKRAS